MPTIGWPAMATSPWSGCSNPAISRSVVVLPQPDGPRKEWNEPRGISKDTASTAATSPNRFDTR